MKHRTTSETVRKAFKLAQTERPGAVFLTVPEDVKAMLVPQDAVPIPVNVVHEQRAFANSGGSGCKSIAER